MTEDVKDDLSISNFAESLGEIMIPSQNEIEFKEKFFLRSQFTEMFEHLKAEIQNSNIDNEEKERLAIILDCIPSSEMFEQLTGFKLYYSKIIILHAVYSYLGLSNSVKGKKQNLLVEKKFEFKKDDKPKRNFWGKEVIE